VAERTLATAFITAPVSGDGVSGEAGEGGSGEAGEGASSPSRRELGAATGGGCGLSGVPRNTARGSPPFRRCSARLRLCPGVPNEGGGGGSAGKAPAAQAASAAATSSGGGGGGGSVGKALVSSMAARACAAPLGETGSHESCTSASCPSWASSVRVVGRTSGEAATGAGGEAAAEKGEPGCHGEAASEDGESTRQARGGEKTSPSSSSPSVAAFAFAFAFASSSSSATATSASSSVSSSSVSSSSSSLAGTCQSKRPTPTSFPDARGTRPRRRRGRHGPGDTSYG